MAHDAIFPISIVIPTVCRPELIRCVRSIFSQSFENPIQILIGVDIDLFSISEDYKQLLNNECPKHISISWIDLGYSTSQRHGGPHSCFFGGSLRTALSFLAQYEHVMYLDDDDWLHPNHLLSISKYLPENEWVFSYSIYANSNNNSGLYTDLIESVGVNKGIYKDQFGGFVRPSGLVINKIKLVHLLGLWSLSISAKGDGEDRLFFSEMRHFKGACTEEATVYYSIDPNDEAHPIRLKYLEQNNISYIESQKNSSIR
jgi:hypothetical protein